MAIAKGTTARLYKTAAAHTNMTAEACTESTTTRFVITDRAKRFLDDTHVFTVYDGGVEVNAANYTIEYPAGTIVFTSSMTGKTITITGGYFAIAKTYLTNEASLSYDFDLVEMTCHGDTGRRVYPTSRSHTLTVAGIHESNVWQALAAGRVGVVFSSTGTYNTDHIDSGERWLFYANVAPAWTATAKDIQRDNLSLKSTGNVYYRSD